VLCVAKSGTEPSAKDEKTVQPGQSATEKKADGQKEKD
jgi:hypothetical protein